MGHEDNAMRRSKNTDLIHCVYSSAATVELSNQELNTLLDTARAINSKLNITGMLLYEKRSFFQVLEGPANVVKALYAKIDRDKRHDTVVKIIEEPIDERSFSDWTMGYAGVTGKELKEIEGLNDFFSSQKCYTELDENRAKTLLAAFKSGKWRSTLH